MPLRTPGSSLSSPRQNALVRRGVSMYAKSPISTAAIKEESIDASGFVRYIERDQPPIALKPIWHSLHPLQQCALWKPSPDSRSS
jgi:hypothetical protein